MNTHFEDCMNKTINNIHHRKTGGIRSFYSALSVYLLLLSSLLLPSACAHTMPPASQTTKNESLPSWVTSPPEDTESTLYGIGAGKNLKESKQSALADIAGKINTKVSNQTQVLLRLKDNDLHSRTTSNTLTEVAPTELNNYQLDNSTIVGNTFWSLLSLSVVDFSATQEQELLKTHQELSLFSKRYDSYPAFKKFLLTDKFHQLIIKAEKQLMHIQILIFLEKGDDYQQLYQNHRTTIAQNNDSLSIEIKADEHAQAIAEYMVEMIADTGIKTHTRDTPPADTILNITTSYTDEMKKSAYQVKLKTIFSLTDKNNTVISKANYLSIAKSNNSVKDALALAAKKLSVQLKRKGFKKAVGIKS